MADIIQDVILRVSSDAEDLRKGIAKVDDKVKDTKKQASGLQNAFKNLLPAIGVGAVVAGLTKIAKASIDAAAKAEGIEQAFKRFGDSGLLDELRTKTKNLVSDVELQKQAVKFEQFNLPLEDLGNLLAFATQRAQDTGESVDFLTNSIVTGLARKSLPILDNLGLNTKEIAEEAEKAGNFFKGVGAIVSREMEKASGATETYSQRVQKLEVTLDNAQVNLGKLLLPAVSDATAAFGSLTESALEFLKVPLSEQVKQEQTELNLLVKSIVNTNEENDVRNVLLEQLNSKYPTFLANIDSEKITNDKLLETLKLVNKEYDLKIKKLALEEIRTKKEKESIAVLVELTEKQQLATKQLEMFKNVSQEVNDIIQNEDALTLQEQYKKLNDELQKTNALEGSYKDGTASRKENFNRLEKTIDKINSLEAEKNELSKEAIDLEETYQEFLAKNPLLNGNGRPTPTTPTTPTDEEVKTILDKYQELNKQLEELSIQRDELLRLKGLSPSADVEVEIDKQINLLKNKLEKIDIELVKFGINEISMIPTEEVLDDAFDRLRDKVDKKVGEKVKPVKIDIEAEENENVAEGVLKVLESTADLVESFGIGEAVQKEIDQLDELISKQQEVVTSAKTNAEQGNADQLALEEERLSQLQAQQDAALKKKEKNAKAEIAINKSLALSQSIVAIASAAKEGASALVLIPLIISALAAGISTVTSLTSSSFFDGTEDTGRGGKLDSRGGFSAILHPNERVMNAKQNKRIKSALGNVSNDDLVTMIENSKGMSIGTNGLLIDSGAINEKMGNKMDEMIQVNRQMLKAMKRNGVNVNIDKNGLSVMMHSMVKRQDIINRI